MSLLDSDIKTIKIGKHKKKRDLAIYPFSIKDQREFLKIYVDAVNDIVVEAIAQEKDDHEFISDIANIVIDNIELVLQKVTFGEDVDKVMGELTNSQVLDIADIVYDQNFGSLDLKKVPESQGKIQQDSPNIEDMQVAFILSKTSYDLTHFTLKSYAEGGLSYKQFTALLDSLAFRESNENKFLAAIHGVKLKGDKQEATHSAAVDLKNINVDEMSEEEKQALTDKMIEEEMAGFNKFMAATKKV